MAARTVERQDAAHGRDVGVAGSGPYTRPRSARNRFSKAQQLPAAHGPFPGRRPESAAWNARSRQPVRAPPTRRPVRCRHPGMERNLVFGRILTHATTSARPRGRTTPSGRISYTLASEAYICTKTRHRTRHRPQPAQVGLDPFSLLVHGRSCSTCRKWNRNSVSSDRCGEGPTRPRTKRPPPADVACSTSYV